MTLQVLVLAGKRAKEAEEPSVLLTERNGQLLVERLVERLVALDARLTFVVRADDVRRHHIDNVVRLTAPGGQVVVAAEDTAGAACTALLALHYLNLDDELLILAANEFLDIDYPSTLEDFRARNLDAATVTFPSLHPRYAYVALDSHGQIVEVAEKRPISRYATAGFYWYRRAGDFVEAAKDMIRKDAHVENSFYLSMTFNQLVLKRKKLGVREIEARCYVPLKSKRQVSLYEDESAAERLN